MKIEIDLDIESIIIEALRKKEAEKAISIPVGATNSRSKWEYGRKNGRRRTAEEMALHELEREKGRRLTPEEKGEVKGQVMINETIETEAMAATIKKDRIEKMAAEGLAAASKELEEEEQHELMHKEVEATIPKVEKLDTESLFS